MLCTVNNFTADRTIGIIIFIIISSDLGCNSNTSNNYYTCVRVSTSSYSLIRDSSCQGHLVFPRREGRGLFMEASQGRISGGVAHPMGGVMPRGKSRGASVGGNLCVCVCTYVCGESPQSLSCTHAQRLLCVFPASLILL